MSILFVGIPGSGKTSILNEAIRVCPSLIVVNYGDVMLEEAQVESRDQLRKLPVEKQKEIGLQAAKKIPKGALVDTHALIRTDLGYCPGLPFEVLNILSPQACVMIECAPSLILWRRSDDNSRDRDLESEEAISTHQELSRAYLCACSMITGAQICLISNDSPYIQENAQPLIQLLKELHVIEKEEN